MKSLTPRLRIASCQRGSAFTACTAAWKSRRLALGRTPGTGCQDRTFPSVSETTTSVTSRSDRSYSTTLLSRGGAWPVSS